MNQDNERNRMIDEIENLYETKKEEYQRTKDVRNRLEATKEVNVNEFTKLYETMDSHLINLYNLKLNKPIDQLSLTEIEEVQKKMDYAFNDIYSKLDKYLRTGETAELGNLLQVEELLDGEPTVQESQQIVEEHEVNRLDEMLEQSNITFDYHTREDVSLYE